MKPKKITKSTNFRYGAICPNGNFYSCEYAGHNDLLYNLQQNHIIPESTTLYIEAIDKTLEFAIDSFEDVGWVKLSGSRIFDENYIQFSVNKSFTYGRPWNENTDGPQPKGGLVSRYIYKGVFFKRSSTILEQYGDVCKEDIKTIFTKYVKVPQKNVFTDKQRKCIKLFLEQKNIPEYKVNYHTVNSDDFSKEGFKKLSNEHLTQIWNYNEQA